MYSIILATLDFSIRTVLVASLEFVIQKLWQFLDAYCIPKMVLGLCGNKY